MTEGLIGGGAMTMSAKGSGDARELEQYRREKAPLADRMRPRTLEEFLGQEHLMGPGRAFRRALEEDRITSLIFWGPPGTGKTTLGRLIARVTGRAFIHLSAVTSGVKDIKEAVRTAREEILFHRRGTLLFIDEIHRFNKAQQDALLPHVEDGTLTLVGATTENPSFEVNSALLSRAKVYVLEPLGEEELETLLHRALGDPERGLGKLGLQIEEDAVRFLVSFSMGDGRVLLSHLELAALRAVGTEASCITQQDVEEVSGRQALLYDKDGEEHYNLISALHKSLRGSDPQAAVYYLMRMLKAGEDPLYVARRMVRFASEDVGCADPQALVLAMSVMNAVHFLGMPECDTALVQLAVYLASAPKSNAVYRAAGRASKCIEETGHLPVPLKIRNAPTKLMKNLGYGAGYRYPHDAPEAYVPEEYLPEAVTGRRFYVPTSFGFERDIAKRMAYWDRLRKEGENKEGDG